MYVKITMPSLLYFDIPHLRRKGLFMGLWTLTHLYQIIPSFLIFAVLSVIAAKYYSKFDKSARYIPLQAIAVALLFLEIMKQINVARDGSYDLYALPFHYCSLFLFLLPIHAFYRGKYSHITDTAAFACLTSLVLDMLLMPAVIYSDSNIINYFNSFGDFHTVTFHNLVVLYFMLTVALRLYEFNTKRDLKVMAIFFGVYVAIASIMSYTLKTNFHNLYRCNIAFLEEVRVAVVDAIGIFGTILYVCVMFVLTILFSYAAYALARLVIKIIDKLKACMTKGKTAA